MVEIKRREQGAASGDRIIPVTVAKDVTAWSPEVSLRDPNPSRIPYGPVSRSPGIVILSPGPATGDPEVIF